MGPDHGVALEALALPLDIREMRERPLGGFSCWVDSAEIPALFEWLVTSLYIQRMLRECHTRHISLTSGIVTQGAEDVEPSLIYVQSLVLVCVDEGHCF